MIIIVLSCFLSYLIGSIPFGYLVAKLTKGIDIRQHGSGNIGATNVARVLGKIPGVVTLVMDMLKGFIAVTMVPMLLSGGELSKILCVVFVISGHNWPVFLQFRGGKGVSTTAGALIGLFPIVFASCFCLWGLVFTLTRYVSAASILAAVSLPVFLFLYKEPVGFQVLGVIVALIGIWRHQTNIKRLISGTEKKFSFKKI